MFNVNNLVRLSELMKPLEEHHPILSLWRTQRDGGYKTSRVRKARRLLRRVRDLALSKALQYKTPRSGQVVFYATSNTPSTLGSLLPIIREYCKRGETPFVLINHSTLGLLNAGLDADFSDYRSWLVRVPHNSKQRVRKESLDLSNQVAGIFELDYDDDFGQSLETAMMVRVAARRYLKCASALVLENDFLPVNKGLALAARDEGVPVIMIQHGFFGRHQFPMICDVFLAWGDYFKKQAVQFGLKDHMIRVTGCPRWDEIHDLKREDHDLEIRRKLGGSDFGPLVLLLSTAHVSAYFPTVFSAYFSGVQRLVDAGINVAVRLHPAEKDFSAYESNLPQSVLSRMTIAPRSVSLYESILNSDVVLNVMSTSAIEAMLLGKPTLFSHGLNRSVLTDFPDYGGGSWTCEADVVEDCLRYGSKGKARDSLLEKQEEFLNFAVANRSCSVSKTMTIIEEVIAARRSR